VQQEAPVVAVEAAVSSSHTLPQSARPVRRSWSTTRTCADSSAISCVFSVRWDWSSLAFDRSHVNECRREEMNSLSVRGCEGAGDLDRIETKTLIEAAHPIPLEIDRHVLVANGSNFADDLGAQLGVERAWQLLARNLEAG
jgi:hypothetical protein